MNKKVLIGLLVLVVLVLGMYFPRTGGTIVERVVGAVPSLDGIDSPWVSINGVKQYWYFQPMNSATSSVVCSIKNPFDGPATLKSYSFNATSTDKTRGGIGTPDFDLSTSTTQYATSTPSLIRDLTMIATAGAAKFNAVWTMASTTNTRVIGESNLEEGASAIVIPRNVYLNLRLSTTTAPGTFTTYLTGECRGVFEKL